jgi:hypothetical protein
MTLHHNDSDQRSNDDGPVTTIVSRKARKGKIREFEVLLEVFAH